MGELIPLALSHSEVEVCKRKLDLMSVLLREVSPDNFCGRTFDGRTFRVK